MKRYIALIALIVCVQTFAMHKGKSGCGCAQIATDTPVAQQWIRRMNYLFKDTADAPEHGAKIEQSNSGHHVTRIFRPKGLWAHLMNRENKIQYQIADVVPGNITLLEDTAETYDVIYRGEDGTIIAKNLETGKELYHIACDRQKGDAHEALSQSHNHWIMVTNCDGSHKIWSHQDMKHRALGNQSCCRGSRAKSN